MYGFGSRVFGIWGVSGGGFGVLGFGVLGFWGIGVDFPQLDGVQGSGFTFTLGSSGGLGFRV